MVLIRLKVRPLVNNKSINKLKYYEDKSSRITRERNRNFDI